MITELTGAVVLGIPMVRVSMRTPELNSFVVIEEVSGLAAMNATVTNDPSY